MSSAPVLTPPAAAPRPGIRVLGAPRTPLRDGYHAFLRASWPAAIAQLVAVYFVINVLFAIAYARIGGIAHAAKGSVLDAFYFSAQTLGTIGYGAMYPETHLANAVMVVESITGLLVTALATGLMFAKFGRATARVMFCRRAVIGPYDGVPTLMIRVGNARSNQIVGAEFRITMVRTERTREGVTYYRMYDLKLTRERTAALARGYTLMHKISPDSPLHGYSPERMVADELELNVVVMGLDDTTFQPVHAMHDYTDREIVWGARHADVISEDPNGQLVLDLTRFHAIVPTEPVEGFPYHATMA